MTKRTLFLLLGLLLLLGCQNQAREQQLRQREAALAQREQQLVLREQALALREQQPAPPPAPVPDSAQTASLADSTRARRLAGTWDTRMSCIETDCPGSAIGDSKSEQWQISYAAGTVLVRATVKNQLVRVYAGTLTGNVLELTAQHQPNEQLPDARITAQLELADDDRHLEGRREIERPTNCRIVYALDLTRPATSNR